MSGTARRSAILEVGLDLNPLIARERPDSGPQTTSISAALVWAPWEAVPEGSHLPQAKKTNPTGERERSGEQRTATSRSNGIVGTGVAGPSNSTSVAGPSRTTSITPFAYSAARAQQIWGRVCAGDYLGAHALFHPREQGTFITGQAKVQQYLDEHPNTRLRAPQDGRSRQSLHICGASAIWKRVGNATAGATPQYELTYEPCIDSAFASADNYKKHVYRHHLGKVYKRYY